jgi:hypothetical protein
VPCGRRGPRERERERGGPSRLADGTRPAAARDWRAQAAWRGHATRPAEQGRGKGADRWATTTVLGGCAG